ncbi:hypothetical protein HYH03_005441 [Edaphochlamys debaryana]|uniref:PPPDE domain-containing protein n=1 Tax=Edaphochlamys debaryana TaxID=47281 RepID=A0A835Y5P5_9CHLO|nr:hypothetical protein HYH03_005441 [Edaphochlamys debaryana]|eukprot:KAG2496620.1 hypothetical protein HYH03_005441 [Edaphochlamys debaryana]
MPVMQSDVTGCLSCFGLGGAFHSGIEVGGVEYAFGGHHADDAGILVLVRPLHALRREAEEAVATGEDDELGTAAASLAWMPRLRSRSVVGWWMGPLARLEELLRGLRYEELWTGPTYRLLSRNCNHFARAMCAALLRHPDFKPAPGKTTPEAMVPSHVTRLTAVALALGCCMPWLRRRMDGPMPLSPYALNLFQGNPRSIAAEFPPWFRFQIRNEGGGGHTVYPRAAEGRSDQTGRGGGDGTDSGSAVGAGQRLGGSDSRAPLSASGELPAPRGSRLGGSEDGVAAGAHPPTSLQPSGASPSGRGRQLVEESAEAWASSGHTAGLQNGSTGRSPRKPDGSSGGGDAASEASRSGVQEQQRRQRLHSGHSGGPGPPAPSTNLSAVDGEPFSTPPSLTASASASTSDGPRRPSLPLPPAGGGTPAQHLPPLTGSGSHRLLSQSRSGSRVRVFPDPCAPAPADESEGGGSPDGARRSRPPTRSGEPGEDGEGAGGATASRNTRTDGAAGRPPPPKAGSRRLSAELLRQHEEEIQQRPGSSGRGAAASPGQPPAHASSHRRSAPHMLEGAPPRPPSANRPASRKQSRRASPAPGGAPAAGLLPDPRSEGGSQPPTTSPAPGQSDGNGGMRGQDRRHGRGTPSSEQQVQEQPARQAQQAQAQGEDHPPRPWSVLSGGYVDLLFNRSAAPTPEPPPGMPDPSALKGAAASSATAILAAGVTTSTVHEEETSPASQAARQNRGSSDRRGGALESSPALPHARPQSRASARAVGEGQQQGGWHERRD